MTDPSKLAKLVTKLQHLVSRLEAEQELAIHQHVSQFYYMQKVTELNILYEQFEDIRKRTTTLAERIDKEYACVVGQWRSDLKWLNSHIRIRDHSSLR